MEFRDLKKQYIKYKEKIDNSINAVLNTGCYIQGKQVDGLEEELADFAGVKHCITCANGTDALQISLMAMGVGYGDAVFVPDFTFFSSGEVIPVVGATPVFVDIDRKTFNISVDSLKKAIENVIHNTNLIPRVIVAVDLFGQPADYTGIKGIADKYDLLILEDGAQGFGGKINDAMNCSFGNISTTSFFPAKPLGCYGDGGAIFTNSDEYNDMLRSLCVHGKGMDKYDNVRIGFNSRLDSIQAAVLRQKLLFLNEELMACNINARLYTEYLEHCVGVPFVMKEATSAWAQYTILLKDAGERKRVMEALEQQGIPSMIYYRKGLHKQSAFKDYQLDFQDCSVTDDVSERCLSLPMHAYLEEWEIAIITDTICKAVKG